MGMAPKISGAKSSTGARKAGPGSQRESPMLEVSFWLPVKPTQGKPSQEELKVAKPVPWLILAIAIQP